MEQKIWQVISGKSHHINFNFSISFFLHRFWHITVIHLNAMISSYKFLNRNSGIFSDILKNLFCKNSFIEVSGDWKRNCWNVDNCTTVKKEKSSEMVNFYFFFILTELYTITQVYFYISRKISSQWILIKMKAVFQLQGDSFFVWLFVKIWIQFKYLLPYFMKYSDWIILPILKSVMSSFNLQNFQICLCKLLNNLIKSVINNS